MVLCSLPVSYTHHEDQDMLFRAVSREEKNLFLVGDVKQSIYRFRQAMPEIFLEKKRHFAPYDGEHYPAKILLGRNFRSRPEEMCIRDRRGPHRNLKGSEKYNPQSGLLSTG